MSASRVGRPAAHSWIGSPAYQNIHSASHLPLSPPLLCPHHCRYRRTFSSSARNCEQQQQRRASFGSRLRTAWNRTKVEWYPIPVGLGIGFLGLAQLYRIRQREKLRIAEEEKERLENEGQGSGDGREGRPKKRKRIRPSGPWQVQVMSTLPLKAVSRLWGRFNELQIPYYLRVPGFKLYAWVFGVNLAEASETDLHVYPNLASFFYRTLKPGVRPLDPNPSALLSPADGRVLQYGTIERGEVEQVKGMTYSLDALLGSSDPGTSPNPSSPTNIFASPSTTSPTSNLDQGQTPPSSSSTDTDEETIKSHEEFANMNGISYTLPTLFSGTPNSPKSTPSPSTDASTTPLITSEAEVRADLALGDTTIPWYARSTSKNHTSLFYVVIYLAPGDYHRFHSPVSWIVSRRRHFAGELYSVSPYLQRTLPGLFTLNERVVLLGRWRFGFFSMTPVGATNVGSIKINFDRELRTNSLTTDTAADRAAEEAAERGETYAGFAEATYEGASRVLGGHALKRGEEMGGFQLGSSIVLVFEAPVGEGGERKVGWTWAVEKGQKVKYGEMIGRVEDGGV